MAIRDLVTNVTVIVVNFNGGSLLRRCIAALAAQTVRSFEVVLVDNGSTDGSLEALGELSSNVRMIRTGRNLGFAAANNVGLRESRSEWVALVNPDAFPAPDWLQRMLDVAGRRPEFDSFASRTVLADQPDLLDGAGDVYHVSGLFWRRGHAASGDMRFVDDEEVFCPCAAAALYRRSALERVGGFDEDFFCYAEDVDLGFRLRLSGSRCLYVAGAVVAHVGSAITGRRSDFSVYYGHRNLVWAYVKNMPPALFWAYLPAHLALNLVTVLWFAARGQGRVIVRAKWDAMASLARMWSKRRAIQAGRRVGAREIRRVMATGLPFRR
jgi:GT2 family glycosyltransferase